MKTPSLKIAVASLLFLGIIACKKGEASFESSSMEDAAESQSYISDSISSAATVEIKDKKFIKTANINMEVKDVYDATISIENTLTKLNGFVTHSNLQSNIVSENTYNTSDEEAMLVKKFQTENTMQVRIPTENLGEFLKLINDKKLFLNSRVINAEDISSTIKYAELEGKRLKKNAEEIAQIKKDSIQVKMSNNNRIEENHQALANLDMSDQIRYSTVDIYIKEPKLRIAEIAVTNSQNIDNKYKFNFIYSLKNAVVYGYYLIQKIVIALVTIWPLLAVAGLVFYIVKRRKLKLISNNSSKKLPS